MKLHFFKMIPEVSSWLKCKKDVLGTGSVLLECSVWEPQALYESGQEAGEEGPGVEVCEPRETSYPGPLPRGSWELEWMPSLGRTHQILKDS